MWQPWWCRGIVRRFSIGQVEADLVKLFKLHSKLNPVTVIRASHAPKLHRSRCPRVHRTAPPAPPRCRSSDLADHLAGRPAVALSEVATRRSPRVRWRVVLCGERSVESGAWRALGGFVPFSRSVSEHDGRWHVETGNWQLAETRARRQR